MERKKKDEGGRGKAETGSPDSFAIGVPKAQEGWAGLISAPNRYIAGMTTRRLYDDELHAHYVTFKCYKRSRIVNRTCCADTSCACGTLAPSRSQLRYKLRSADLHT
jgi:hypothetical protein